MSRAYTDIAFTTAVRDMQTRMGSRANYAPLDFTEDRRDVLTEREAEFIEARDGFYQATVSETGWPYVQFRGGPAGFLKVLDAKTIGFADFRGNVQYISVGNLQGNDRISIILMDYANRRRLKLLGRVRLVSEAEDPALVAKLELPSYRARVERAFIITIEGYDWNCPQHITPRFTESEVQGAIEPLHTEIAELKAALKAAQAQQATSAVKLQELGKGPLPLRITGIRQLTPRVRAFELRTVDGSDLPAIKAGAHLDVPVQLASGVQSTRRYSISSNPTRRDAYEIAVLHEPEGQGGSAAIHATFDLGMVLHCSLPGNDFALDDAASKVILVAGGIGITPIKSMALELLAQGRDFEVHYTYRSRKEAAYLDRLERQIGDRLISYDSSQGKKLDTAQLLQQVPAGSPVYVCGPSRLIDALTQAAHAQGLSADRVHHEQFNLDTNHQGHPFVVKLAKSGADVWVSSNVSALQAIESAGWPVQSGCRTGSCGSCVVKVKSGDVIHRDSFLTDEQKAEGQMCLCVSRAAKDVITLDL